MLAKPLSYSAVDPSGTPRAVVMVLHGFGASGDDFMSIVPQLGLPASMGVRFVFPHAPEMAVGMLGGQQARAWFDFELGGGLDLGSFASQAMSGLAGSEPAGFGALVEGSVNFPGIAKATLRIRDLLQAEIDSGVPADRIVLAGFSQGGALALNTALLYPKPLAGILGLSTFLADGSKLGTPRARANAQTPILLCHGQQDNVLPLALGRDGRDRLHTAGYAVNWQEYPMGHEVCSAQITAIGNWLRQRLSP